MSAIKEHYHDTIKAAQRSQPKERPILFSPEMVLAILQGRKTQTRRIIKPQPRQDAHGGWEYGKDYRNSCTPVTSPATDVLFPYECPYGTPGDRLWVRETWSRFGEAIFFKAENSNAEGVSWRPSIHMPRAASRITLLITDIRAQPLHDITQADAYDEGFEWVRHGDISPLYQFQKIWEKINGPHSWQQNPWVWAITFQKID